MTELHELSSPLTFVFKFVFPALWIGGFGLVALSMWLAPTESPENDPVLEFTVAWVVGSVFLLALARRLKAVRLVGDTLWVSNYLRWISIPLADVERVEQVRWWSPHPIFIYLRHKTDFGDRFGFVPLGIPSMFRANPLVDELQRLADEAASRERGA